MAESDAQKIYYHIDAGPQLMYPVDGANAVAQHPGEWSAEPWAPGVAEKARKNRYDEQVAMAKQQGVEPPPPPAPEPEMSDADKQMLSEDAKGRAEALKRVQKYEEEEAAKAEREAQYKSDKAWLAAPPPAVDVTQRRPFGRPGEMTPAERSAFLRRAAEKAKKDQEGSAEDEADVNSRTAAKEMAEEDNKRKRR